MTGSNTLPGIGTFSVLNASTGEEMGVLGPPFADIYLGIGQSGSGLSGYYPPPVAFDSANGDIFLGNIANALGQCCGIAVINGSTNSLIWSPPRPKNATESWATFGGMIYDPVNGEIYATSSEIGNVLVIDPSLLISKTSTSATTSKTINSSQSSRSTVVSTTTPSIVSTISSSSSSSTSSVPEFPFSLIALAISTLLIVMTYPAARRKASSAAERKGN